VKDHETTAPQSIIMIVLTKQIKQSNNQTDQTDQTIKQSYTIIIVLSTQPRTPPGEVLDSFDAIVRCISQSARLQATWPRTNIRSGVKRHVLVMFLRRSKCETKSY
jgi:hypothetical protein